MNTITNKMTIFAFAASLLAAVQANASEPADWYLVTEAGNWGTTAECQFQTTEQENVYQLSSYSIPGNMAYKITDSAWSEYYGWADGGSITETGVAYPLGAMANGNGWCALAAGTYDITFNQSDKTITFVLSENQGEVVEGNIWYMTGTFNNWALDVKFEQDSTDPTLFVLDNYTISESAITDGYWNFEIVTPSWAIEYICTEDVAQTDKEYSFVKRYDGLNSFSSLATGTYKFIWNTNNHTLKIETSTSSGVSDINVDSNFSATEYYNLSGTKVAEADLTPGIYIKKYGYKSEKIVIR